MVNKKPVKSSSATAATAAAAVDVEVVGSDHEGQVGRLDASWGEVGDGSHIKASSK